VALEVAMWVSLAASLLVFFPLAMTVSLWYVIPQIGCAMLFGVIGFWLES